MIIATKRGSYIDVTIVDDVYNGQGLVLENNSVLLYSWYNDYLLAIQTINNWPYKNYDIITPAHFISTRNRHGYRQTKRLLDEIFKECLEVIINQKKEPNDSERCN